METKRQKALRLQEEVQEKKELQQKCAQWKKQKSHHDITIIAGLLDVSVVTVSKAVNKGDVSLKILRGINDYFNKK